jgi:hypothetical protein
VAGLAPARLVPCLAHKERDIKLKKRVLYLPYCGQFDSWGNEFSLNHALLGKNKVLTHDSLNALLHLT